MAGHVSRERDTEQERWEGIVSWHTLLSGDRTPTGGLTLGTAELAPGATVDGALHRHEPPEAYYVLAGEGVVHIDGEEHPIEAGAAVHVPGGAWHFVHNTGDVPLRLVFVFPVDSYTDVVYEHPMADER